MISVDCKPLMFDYLSNGSQHISQPDLQKVRRVLFGPVDHEASEKFVTSELRKQITFNSKKWNFDFEKEEILDPKGIYIWKAEIKTEQVRRLKRKRPEEESHDNSDLYFDASLCSNIKHSTKQTEEKSEGKQSNKPEGSQRLMTDYLTVKKHSMIESKKKAGFVPIKKPRLATS